jgi:hypothetical protein
MTAITGRVAVTVLLYFAAILVANGVFEHLNGHALYKSPGAWVMWGIWIATNLTFADLWRREP